MILSAHILTGAAILSKTTNPILGFLFAFLSHYLLDFLPHREYSIDNILKKEWKQTKNEFLKVFLDVFIGFLIVLIVLFLKNKGEMDIWRFYFQNLPIFLGGFLGILADGLTFLYLLLPKSKFLETLHNFHRKIHFLNSRNKLSPNPAPPKGAGLGLFTQLLIGVLAIYFLYTP